MHGFWTLVKAEFTVEVISRILFSGKFPRPVAFFLIFVFFVWFVITRIFKIFRYLFCLIFIGKKGRIRKELKKIITYTNQFEDQTIGPTRNGEFLTLTISNASFNRGIEQITIRVNIRTEQLNFTINRGQRVQILPYESIVFFSYPGVQLHLVDALIIYQNLRINLL